MSKPPEQASPPQEHSQSSLSPNEEREILLAIASAQLSSCIVEQKTHKLLSQALEALKQAEQGRISAAEFFSLVFQTEVGVLFPASWLPRINQVTQSLYMQNRIGVVPDRLNGPQAAAERLYTRAYNDYQTNATSTVDDLLKALEEIFQLNIPVTTAVQNALILAELYGTPEEVAELRSFAERVLTPAQLALLRPSTFR